MKKILIILSQILIIFIYVTNVNAVTEYNTIELTIKDI